MWKLTIEDDEGKQTHLPLAHEEYGIGRSEPNSIRLTDRNVSRNHAILRKNGQGWFLKDLQSYNGTYVNGVRVVGEQGVHSGDVVQLGDYRLEMLDEGISVAITPGVPSPTIAPAHQRPNRLVVVVGPQPGTEYPLDREHFTIGRSEDATISINHSSVSRVHAELFALGNGRFEIVDKASANGIRINGVELKRGILEAGDALELGDVRLRFVGAGKIYRADVTQNLPAVAGFDMSRSVGGQGARAGVGVGKLIGLGAAVGLAAVIILVVVLGRGTTASTIMPRPKHVVTEQNARQVDDALKLLDAKDFDGAHKKLLEIPDEARPTDDPNFKKVEAAWADWKFQQVNDAADSTKKKTILKEIASTDTVDAKQRTRAADMIREIEAKEPPPPAPTYERPVGALPANTAPAATTAESPTASTAPAVSVPSGTQDYDKMKRQLEPKVWGGRGSVDDIRMLKAVCKQLGDRVCRDRADALLKKKLEQ